MNFGWQLPPIDAAPYEPLVRAAEERAIRTDTQIVQARNNIDDAKRAAVAMLHAACRGGFEASPDPNDGSPSPLPPPTPSQLGRGGAAA
jgi:hypothetical protein